MPAEFTCILGVFCLFFVRLLGRIDSHLKEAEEGIWVHRAGVAN